MAIGMKLSKKDANIDRFKLMLEQSINKSINIMQNKAMEVLNPSKYELSSEAKKRLKWIYLTSLSIMILCHWRSFSEKLSKSERKTLNIC